MNWNVKKKKKGLPVFDEKRMEQRVTARMKSTELCLNGDCVDLNLSWRIYQMIIDMDIL